MMSYRVCARTETGGMLVFSYYYRAEKTNTITDPQDARSRSLHAAWKTIYVDILFRICWCPRSSKPRSVTNVEGWCHLAWPEGDYATKREPMHLVCDHNDQRKTLWI